MPGTVKVRIPMNIFPGDDVCFEWDSVFYKVTVPVGVQPGKRFTALVSAGSTTNGMGSRLTIQDKAGLILSQTVSHVLFHQNLAVSLCHLSQAIVLTRAAIMEIPSRQLKAGLAIMKDGCTYFHIQG